MVVWGMRGSKYGDLDAKMESLERAFIFGTDSCNYTQVLKSAERISGITETVCGSSSHYVCEYCGTEYVDPMMKRLRCTQCGAGLKHFK